MAFENIQPGTVAVCACAADNAQIEIIGEGLFTAHLAGSMTAVTGTQISQDGLATIPLAIAGHSTQGQIEGGGGISVSHDLERTPPLSKLQELAAGTGFPAMQEMNVNILVHVDALPGVTLRNVKPGSLRNSSQSEFPPQNASYNLQCPMDLEDAANPGTVVARIHSYSTLINPSGGHKTFDDIQPGTVAVCACASDDAQIEVIGQGMFSAHLAGSMTAVTGTQIEQDGLATIPLAITGHSTQGSIAGGGRIAVNHDPERTPPLSRLQELAAGTSFPAMQEMNVNILVTLDALPGVTLRNVCYGTLRNNRQGEFPPQNARYDLQQPMDLEDTANPGTVVARIHSYTTRINPTSGKQTFDDIHPGTVAVCACAADNAEIEVIGQGTFIANLSGSMTAVTGTQIEQDGLATIPLAVAGHSTTGQIAGGGAVAVNHDPERTPPLSRLQELAAGTSFPAMQEMNVNILVTLDALPGVTLRNVCHGTLRNDSQDSFPPRNAPYSLQCPMDLEDAANPGTVIARIKSYTTTINPNL